MKTIYKYILKPWIKETVDLPEGAQILKVENQHGEFCLWALVNTRKKLVEQRKIIIRGTGHEVEYDNIKFISTFQIDDGRFIFHAFEVI